MKHTHACTARTQTVDSRCCSMHGHAPSTCVVCARALAACATGRQQRQSPVTTDVEGEFDGPVLELSAQQVNPGLLGQMPFVGTESPSGTVNQNGPDADSAPCMRPVATITRSTLQRQDTLRVVCALVIANMLQALRQLSCQPVPALDVCNCACSIEPDSACDCMHDAAGRPARGVDPTGHAPSSLHGPCG